MILTTLRQLFSLINAGGRRKRRLRRNNMLSQLFGALLMQHNSSFSPVSLSKSKKYHLCMSFHFASSNYVGKYSMTFLTVIIEFARDLQHNCRMLKFCNFESKSLGGHNSLICDPIGILRLLPNFYCIKELRQYIIILICGHMAQNPLFWDACIMCLMGDIQKQTYFFVMLSSTP